MEREHGKTDAQWGCRVQIGLSGGEWGVELTPENREEVTDNLKKRQG